MSPSADYIRGYEDGWAEAMEALAPKSEEPLVKTGYYQDGDAINPGKEGKDWADIVDEGRFELGDSITQVGGVWHMDRNKQLGGVRAQFVGRANGTWAA